MDVQKHGLTHQSTQHENVHVCDLEYRHSMVPIVCVFAWVWCMCVCVCVRVCVGGGGDR